MQPRKLGHHEHPFRARRRPTRPGPERDHQRAEPADRSRLPAAGLPEPLPEQTEWISGRPGGGSGDPADRVTLDESVSMAFLVVLDSMTPAERVAFILHDVFGYPFAEVAGITGLGCPEASGQSIQ